MERLPRPAPWMLTALGAVAWLVARPATPDLPAHLYRAGLVRDHGPGVWELGWLSGHSLPGYSVLVPILGAPLGPEIVAAAAAVVASWCFTRLACGHWEGTAGRVASWWLALALLSVLLAGQLAFAAGLAPALGALLLGAKGRNPWAALLAAAAILASPVAGAFLLLAAAAWWLADRSRRAPLWIAGGVIVPGLAIAIAFPGEGYQPFSMSSLVVSLAIGAFLLLAPPAREREIRIGAALYLLAVLSTLLIETPMGGNLVRLGALFGGPLAAGALWDERRTLLYIAALPLLYWQWLAPVRYVVREHGDAAIDAAYFAPLERELEARTGGRPTRVEVPFTAGHWETLHLPPRWPLARGWERQADIANNGLFYRPGLTGPRYRAWLEANAVSWVALPDVPLDPAGRQEADLLRAGRVPGVREEWRSDDWRLYRVLDPAPLASPPVAVTGIGPYEIDLRATRPGRSVVRARFSPYWRVEGPASAGACVARAPGGWTEVAFRRAGSARLAISLSPGRIGATGPRCTG